MHEFWAQQYFRQLIAAVEYLHTKGIAHRYRYNRKALSIPTSDTPHIQQAGKSGFLISGIWPDTGFCCRKSGKSEYRISAGYPANKIR
jgi:hypothetical protein